MKNASKYIRQAYKDALADLEYNEIPVPVYESIISVTVPDYYIEITNVSESNVANDDSFIREVSVDLEVITKQYKIQNNDTVDEIAELVMEALIPTTIGQLDTEEFQIGYVYVESSRYLHEVDDKGDYINRKLLTFRQLVTQKSI